MAVFRNLTGLMRMPSYVGKGVTLSLLWEEYRGVHPTGYGYSRYCELYTRWEGKLSPVMRQRHPAGERLFVDYAGPTFDVVCPKTGEGAHGPALCRHARRVELHLR